MGQLKNYVVGEKKVRVTLKDGRFFVGYMLPKTEFSRKDITIIKLDNGYNIGIGSAEIKKTEILKKGIVRKVPKLKIKGKGPKLSVIGTGGTVSSRVDYVTGGVESSMSVDEIFAFVPEAAEHAELRFVNAMRKLSEDMTPKNWAKIAREVYKSLKTSEGAIVLHGTDTMHYTASAISFMVDTTKPIVFTGAQRSSDRPSTDAFMNILCSVHAAKSDIAESLVCFHSSMSDDFNHIIRGNRSRKLHTSARPAFVSVNQPPLASVWPNGKIKGNEDYHKRDDGKLRLKTKMEDRVAIVKAFPGSDPEVLSYYASQGYKGIIIEGTGLGHVPVSPGNGKGWIPVINDFKDELVIVVTSQTVFGRTHKHVYTNLRKLSNLGVTFVGDMTTEAAYAKLMWTLGNHGKDGARELMEKNLKGEMSPRTTVI